MPTGAEEPTGSAVPADLILGLRQELIHCDLIVSGMANPSSRRSTFPAELLSSYTGELVYAPHGGANQDVLSRMREAIASAVPVEGIVDVARHWPRQLISLRLQFTNPRLECLPWELLSYPDAIGSGIRIAVWRDTESRHLPTCGGRIVLLTSSAPIDQGPTGHAEIAQIYNLLAAHQSVTVYDLPGATVSQIRDVLNLRRPAAIYIAVHTVDGKLLLQGASAASVACHDFLPEQLAGVLRGTDSAEVILLNACDSASHFANSPPIAKIVADETGCTVIGTAAKLPAEVGLKFAESFYELLVQGSEVIGAYHGALSSVHTMSRFSALSGAMVMYSRNPNVVVFPVSPHARARRSYEGLCHQLDLVGGDLQAMVSHKLKEADLIERAAFAASRLAMARDEVTSLADNWAEGADDNQSIVSVTMICGSLDRAFAAALGVMHKAMASSLPYAVAAERVSQYRYGWDAEMERLNECIMT
ncbi:hypothetical protein ACWCOT_02230 [Nonomuraea bangladeshensis]